MPMRSMTGPTPVVSGVVLGAALSILLDASAPARADTLPPDGDAWTEAASVPEAAALGWNVENPATQALVVSSASEVGAWSVGCRALQARWCNEFGLDRTEDLAGFTRIAFWHRAAWDDFDFRIRVYMTCTPDEIDQGFDLKRASWPMATATDWNHFTADLADAEWAWRRDGWDWIYSGGNTEPTDLVRIEWFFCQYFDIEIGDELLVDGLQLEVASPIAVPPLPPGPRLEPAVPNPFNPTTEIAFTLACDGPARLAVYALDGRLVRTLVSGHLAAGRHSLTWSGRDGGGRPAPSGAYRLVLDAGGERRVRGVTLLR